MIRKVIFESVTPEQQFLLDASEPEKIFGESGDLTPVGHWLGLAAERGHSNGVDLLGRQGVDYDNTVIHTTPSVDVLRSRLSNSSEPEEVL